MGTFSNVSAIRDFLECTEITPADVDGDGDLDLTAISGSSSVVAWVENRLLSGTSSPAPSGEFTCRAGTLSSIDPEQPHAAHC